MRVARNLRLSLNALTLHPARTALAVAGTAVGVAGVLVLTAVGTGARNAIVERIESLGRNTIVITAASIESKAGRRVQGEDRYQTLRSADAWAIGQASPAILRVAPAHDRDLIARFGAITNPATVIGTTPEWRVIRQFPLEQGRFFTEGENAARARVAVLGAKARDNLFADSIEPVGRIIRIGRVPFEVVGVLAGKGVSADGFATEDDRIIVPLETAVHRLFPRDYIKTIYVEAVAAQINAAERDAAAILRVRHDLVSGAADDFRIQNQRAVLAAELAAQTSFQRLIAGLGLLSLLVGGVGILSIMLLSVRERRAEIAVRVAVGARAVDISVQFLAEALCLAGAGGMLGLVLGWGAARLVSAATEWQAPVTAATLAVAVIASAGIGVLFGVSPAWRAARLDPVEGLR